MYLSRRRYQDAAAMARMEDIAVSEKIELEGEGNYASTISSETGGQDKDQGLTLPPLTQSSDQWLFNAKQSFNASLLDGELEALLGEDVGNGVVQTCFRRKAAEDATEGNLRRDESWVHTLRTHENQSLDQTNKRRKLSRPLSRSPMVQSAVPPLGLPYCPGKAAGKRKSVGGSSTTPRIAKVSSKDSPKLGSVPALPMTLEPAVHSPDSGYGPSISFHQERLSDQPELSENQLQSEEIAVEVASEERSPSPNDSIINTVEDHDDNIISELSSDDFVCSRCPFEAENHDGRSTLQPNKDVPLPSVEKDDLPPVLKRVRLPAFWRMPYWLIPFVGDGKGKENVGDGDGKTKSERSLADKSENGRHSSATQNRPETHLNHQNDTNISHLLFTSSDHQAHNFLPPSIMATTAGSVKDITKANILAAVLTILEDQLSDHQLPKLKSFDIPPAIRDTLNSLWDTIRHEKDNHGIFKTSLFKFALETLQFKLNDDLEARSASSIASDAPLERQLKSITSTEEAKSIIRSNYEAYQRSLSSLEANNKRLNDNSYAAENRALKKQNHVLQAQLVDSESRHWHDQYTKLLLLANRPRSTFVISEAKASQNQPQQHRDLVPLGLAPDASMPNIQLQLNVQNHPTQNPYWMCCLADSLNHGHQCLAINQYFISASGNWSVRKYCKGCGRPNSVNRLYLDDDLAHKMGGLTIRARPEIFNGPNEVPQVRKKSDRGSQNPRNMVYPSFPQTSAAQPQTPVLYAPTTYPFTSIQDNIDPSMLNYPVGAQHSVPAVNAEGFFYPDTNTSFDYLRPASIPQMYDNVFGSHLTVPTLQLPVASPYPPSPYQQSMFAQQRAPVQPAMTANSCLNLSTPLQPTTLSLPVPAVSTSYTSAPPALSAGAPSKICDGFYVPESTSSTLRIEAGNHRAWMGERPARPQLAASPRKRAQSIDLTTSDNEEEGAEGSLAGGLRPKKRAKYAELFGSDDEDEDEEGDAAQSTGEVTAPAAVPIAPVSDSASEYHTQPEHDDFEADLDADLNNYFDENGF